MQKLLATLLTGAFVFVGYQQPAECHKNHCHGKEIKICGGGWKRYKETRTFTGPSGGDKASEACDAAIDEWEEKLAVEAHEKCAEKHPCKKCPSACNGCKPENIMGSVYDVKRKSTKKRSDGSYECEVRAEVAFRCSCGGCIKKGH